MTDRSKRFEKILRKKGLKGWFKPVDSLENSDFVLIDDKRCISNSLLIKTEDYKDMLERDATYPPENVYFLVNRNRRNVLNINNTMLTPRIMSLLRV